MKIAILGTGMVGATIGTKLIELGHQVMMGSRTANNEKATAWVSKNESNASQGTFADAAKFGEIIFNCTNGAGSLDAFKQAGEQNLDGKIILDISNPLDFSKGMPPSLIVCNTDSLAEQLQRAFPDARIVKTLNTINCNVMVNPSIVPGDHDVFVSGNDAEAKSKVKEILTDWFGWKTVIDLGDITSARAAEMWVFIWVRLWSYAGNPNFNLHIAKA